MMAVGTLPFELIWILDFITGGTLIGITAYMFSAENLPLYLLALSLWMLVLPVLIYTPVHLLLKRLFPRPSRQTNS